MGSLNANKGMGGSKMNFKLIEAGSAPARLVQVIDIGLQPDYYQGVEQAPKPRLRFVYEFPFEFMLDEDGNEIKDKPRWLSEDVAFYNLDAAKAKSTLRYNAFDPKGVFGGDFEKCVGAPVMVTVVHNPGKGANKGKVYENIGGVSSMQSKMAETLPGLINKPVIFSLDEPDLAVFMEFPKWIQEEITSNLQFAGSKLEALLGNPNKPSVPPKQVKPETEGDRPY